MLRYHRKKHIYRYDLSSQNMTNHCVVYGRAVRAGQRAALITFIISGLRLTAMALKNYDNELVLARSTPKGQMKPVRQDSFGSKRTDQIG